MRRQVLLVVVQKANIVYRGDSKYATTLVITKKRCNVSECDGPTRATAGQEVVYMHSL